MISKGIINSLIREKKKMNDNKKMAIILIAIIGILTFWTIIIPVICIKTIQDIIN